MSSAASLSGGKYTRDLKLRVLEHYFRNGGDVFGNKQSTAKMFGVDSKTINRFLKISDLVRVARKNAKSNKSSASSSSGFKEPQVPGGSGGRSRPPQRQSVRITLPTQPDESIVSQTADGNTSSIGKLLKIFELGTQEIRDLLASECDLIYECRVCRALFRSVANLLAHKRRYCPRGAADTRQVFGSGPGQSLSASSDGVVVLPLPAAIDRLPEVRQAAAAEARAAAALPVPPVRLEPLPGSGVAVLQTVGEAEQSVGQRLQEVRRLEAAAGRTVRLGRDGRVVDSDAEEEETAEEQAETDGDRHVCRHCNTTFSTRKTLSHHVRSLHSSTRVYYPCSLCSAAFINMFSVERHLQKVHKKKQEEVDVIKEAIKLKSFSRSVTEGEAADPIVNPNMPLKVTSFEWKCRQCSRRYLSLPVGLQHVQSVHPQFSTARAGLVRVCRIIRQAADTGAVSTRSSSGAVTPADLERADQPAGHRGADADHSADDGRMAFNKANLLKRLASGGERCVLCRKVFTGHLQACGHLRLHDQHEIEAYLGQKVRLTRKRRPADMVAEPEEYELDAAAAASPPNEDEEEPESEEAEPESAAESADEVMEEPAEEAAAAEPPPSVEARGFPVQMVAAERVRRRHFVHTLPGGEHVCTLCDARFPRWPAVRAHLARHSRAEVTRYVERYAVEGLVGVPAAISLRTDREGDNTEPGDTEEAADGEEEEPEEGEEEGAEEEEEQGAEEEEEQMDAEEDEEEGEDTMDAEGETASVDTDIAAGAKLLVSCKLWSPEKRRRAAAADQRQRDAAEEEEEEDGDDEERDNAPLTQLLDGETVDKWEVIRRKGSRLRCVICNKTFMKSGYAEVHLRTEHTFGEIRDFVSNWRLKGVRVPLRSGEPGADEAEESHSEEEEEEEEQEEEAAAPQVSAKAKTVARSPQKAVKRPAESPAPAAPPAKVVKRAAPVLNVPVVKTTGNMMPGSVGPIGPNTKILKISRSDLLQRRRDGQRLCLVCDRQFDSHQEACEHMRQHSDADIRNFIKTRGRQFLPAFEQKQQAANLRRASEGAASTAAAPAAAAAKPARRVSSPAGRATDKPSDRPAGDAVSPVKSSKAAAAAAAAAEEEKKEREKTRVEPQPAPPAQYELFDKAQLLKRQPDGTKCLLCTRVFAKHSSACGHLSHHGTAEVQAWRNRMRCKAASLLKLARRPQASSGADDDPAAETTAVAEAHEPQDVSAMEIVEPVADEVVREEEPVTKAEKENPEVNKAKGDDSVTKAVKDASVTKSVKDDSAPVRATRRKDSVPVKVTRVNNTVTVTKTKANDAPTVKPEVTSPVKTMDTDEPRPATRTFHVTGTRGTGRLVKVTEQLAINRAQASVSASEAGSVNQKDTAESVAKPAANSPSTQKAVVNSPSIQKATTNSPSIPKPVASSPSTQKAATSSPATQKAVTSSPSPQKATTSSPSTQKAVTSPASTQKATTSSPSTQKATTSSPSTQKATPSPAQPDTDKPTLSKSPARLFHLPLPPPPATSADKAIQSAAGAAGAVAPARQLVGPAGGTLTVVGSAAGSPTAQLVKPTGQLVKLPQHVKLALLQSADGTLQTAGGRTIMRLAPGVKLPLTAANLPRVLRPIAPKSAGAAAVPVLQPPLAGAVTSPGSSQRPRPPPLLRAPLLQTMARAGGGSITVHVPALKSSAPLPPGAVLTVVPQAAARPAAKTDVAADATADDDAKMDTTAEDVADGKIAVKTYSKTVTKTYVKTDAKDKAGTGKTDGKPDGKTDGKPDGKPDGTPDGKTDGSDKRPSEVAPESRTVAAGEAAAELEGKGEPEVAADDVKLTKRQGEARSGQTKYPAAPRPTGTQAEPAVRSSQRKAAAGSAEKPSDSPSAAAVRPGVVTKRAFIPEVAAKPATRCSWTTEPSGKASPRAAAAEPAASPPEQLPQTRARVDAAVAWRQRQTRRSSGAAERK